jgi:RimJ/RimL family protein N-acetyltransferase
LSDPPDDPITLITPRLELHVFDEQVDAPVVLRLLNEPSFIEFIGDRGVRTPDDARRYLREGPIASCRTHGHGLLRLALRDGGTVIGMCGLVKRDTLPIPDLGFALLPEHWGKGYVQEASRAVLEHGRSALGLTEVLAITSTHNQRSMTTLRALGMALEDTRTLATGASPVNVFRLRLSPSGAPSGDAPATDLSMG